MKNKLAFFILFITVSVLWAQNTPNTNDFDIPLRRVVILTSGLTYYEHYGSINGAVNINLPFRLDAINDALKTLIINDPSSANISVTYQSENTLFQILRSLNIDLSDTPDLPTILARLRGVEIEISTPAAFVGRIAGIEYRPVMTNNMFFNEPWLLLAVRGSMMSFNLKDIRSISFTDPAITNDLNRALDLLSVSRNLDSRQLLINLPADAGNINRNVSLSYVIPSPVWKVSYRLDLGASSPLFQGWAIIDNDSDTDWNNVELSLVAGRPVSFIQMLYPPYYVYRPILPLSIAGTAQAATHDRSFTVMPQADMANMYGNMNMRTMDTLRMSEREEVAAESIPAPLASPALAGGTVLTAAGSEAGGQFEFTIKNPVTLDRHMSAMFPLVESAIDARSTLIYNGTGRHPRIGAEITNTSGMKLPAGPITVYDGGVYAGDALIEFWNEGEKRLISYGEDLSVTADVTNTSTRAVSTVRISGGVMTINRNITFSRTYTFINSGSAAKQIIIEHPRTAQTELVSPTAAEQTTGSYRFNISLPENRETEFVVNEQRPISESLTLLPLRLDTLISYTTNQEIPANVRQALTRAVELRRAVDAADSSIRVIESQRNQLIADQDRIRRNLEAAGNQSQQGQEYLRRLVSLDTEIDTAAANLQRANADARAARLALENYLNGLNL